MRFPKGNNANPKGRGTETEKQRNVAKLLLSPYVKKAALRVGKSLDSPDADDYQWAVNLIFSYLCSKPAQSVDVADSEGVLFKIVIGSND